ncbi:COG1179 Dinucleotide-utilizing enzymes involved in molybdopterin and thiamine biosynthesis family 1 [Methylophilaceae bacterium]
MMDKSDYERRFGGVRRLYGEAGIKKLQAAHIVVIGIGGVGSWTAEALARNAIGQITLIDLDNISESNVNRQLHAVDGAFGKAKVSAMHERILSINPNCFVIEIEDFITIENLESLLNFQCDVIVDCIDDSQAKIALADFCKRKQLPLIMAGSAGGRLDPTRAQVADLAFVTGDRLLSKVRNQLRRDYAFPKASNTKRSAKFGIDCVYSDEQAIKPESACEVDSSAITGLNCAGYGSSVCVTAPFGFTAAQLAIQKILL